MATWKITRITSTPAFIAIETTGGNVVRFAMGDVHVVTDVPGPIASLEKRLTDPVLGPHFKLERVNGGQT